MATSSAATTARSASDRTTRVTFRRGLDACVAGSDVRGAEEDFGIAPKLSSCDRDQELLLPLSLREWLPEGPCTWFVIGAVAVLDLSALCAAYRDNSQGGAAHDPAMMVALRPASRGHLGHCLSVRYDAAHADRWRSTA